MPPRFFFGPARWLQPDSGLTANERLVLAVLCQWTHKSTGECFPAIATIAASAAISRSSVKRAIVGLSGHGAITVRQRRRADGSPDSSVYLILGFDPTPAELEGGVGSQGTEGRFKRGRGVGSHRTHNVLSDNKKSVVPQGFYRNPNGNGLIRVND